VSRVYTSLAVLDIFERHFVLREKLASLGIDTLQELTGAKLHEHGPVEELCVPEL